TKSALLSRARRDDFVAVRVGRRGPDVLLVDVQALPQRLGAREEDVDVRIAPQLLDACLGPEARQQPDLRAAHVRDDVHGAGLTRAADLATRLRGGPRIGRAGLDLRRIELHGQIDAVLGVDLVPRRFGADDRATRRIAFRG